jgi:hypothetical protein
MYIFGLFIAVDHISSVLEKESISDKVSSSLYSINT